MVEQIEVMNELTLLDVCKGGAMEAFELKLRAVSDNIADPNTSAKAKRRITLVFEFSPFPDRRGATVKVLPKADLAELDCSEATSNIYFVKRDGKVRAYAQDVRQELLFGRNEPQRVIAGKDASAGP